MIRVKSYIHVVTNLSFYLVESARALMVLLQTLSGELVALQSWAGGVLILAAPFIVAAYCHCTYFPYEAH